MGGQKKVFRLSSFAVNPKQQPKHRRSRCVTDAPFSPAYFRRRHGAGRLGLGTLGHGARRCRPTANASAHRARPRAAGDLFGATVAAARARLRMAGRAIGKDLGHRPRIRLRPTCTRRWLDRTAAPMLSVIKPWRPICRGPSQTALPNAATRFVAQVQIVSNPRVCVPECRSSATNASVSQR